MTANLPPQLIKFFLPRPPLPFVEPIDRPFEERSRLNISGISCYISQTKGHDSDYIPTFTPQALKAERVFHPFYF